MNKFVVTNFESSREWMRAFDTHQEAMQYAVDLVRKYPSRQYYVLKTWHLVKSDFPIAVIDCDNGMKADPSNFPGIK